MASAAIFFSLSRRIFPSVHALLAPVELTNSALLKTLTWEMTLEEYEKVLKEKRKALESLKTQARKVEMDNELASMKQLSSNKNNDEIFAKLGGKFDHAYHLFQNIEGAYRNCLSNTSDVKELVPKFFYIPEFLLNSNSYHFRVKQDGKPLADVYLPPWAKVYDADMQF